MGTVTFFEWGKAQERAAGFGEQMNMSIPFFRKGQVRSWREGMDEELAATFCAAQAEVMGRFGYLTEAQFPRS